MPCFQNVISFLVPAGDVVPPAVSALPLFVLVFLLSFFVGVLLFVFSVTVVLLLVLSFLALVKGVAPLVVCGGFLSVLFLISFYVLFPGVLPLVLFHAPHGVLVFLRSFFVLTLLFSRKY